MTYIAPAGTVITLADLLRGLSMMFAIDADRVLARTLAQVSHSQHCLPVSSGRAAMTVILKGMRETCRSAPHRDEVIMPGYTCYSVAAAAIKAGLTPRLCDVDPRTLGMDTQCLERLDFSRVLAIVSANLYGIPNQLTEIERIARERGVYLIDDAAQALGARLAGRAVGTYGDAGIFSFDKGKVICTIQGGAIVVSNPSLGQTLTGLTQSLPASSAQETLSNGAKLLAYSILLHPRCYGAIQQLPFLGLGLTTFDTRYPVTRLSSFQAGVAINLAARLEAINDVRRRNAHRLKESLGGLPHIEVPIVAPDAHAVYARFPVRITDPQLRHDVVARLNQEGIGATTSYPRALADVPQVQATLRQPAIDQSGAREVAAQIVTFPTHAYCPPNFAERVARLLRSHA